MKLNLALIILFTLSISKSEKIYSQELKLIKVGDVIFNQNVKIQNDSIDSYYYFTNEGVCYGIDCKYKSTGLNDLKEIQNRFPLNWIQNTKGNNIKEGGHVAFDKYLCEANEGKYNYRLGIDYLDVDEKGIVLVGRFLGMETSNLNPSRTVKSFKSIEDFLTNPEVLKVQEELKVLQSGANRIDEPVVFDEELDLLEEGVYQELYDSTLVKKITLPYKLYFDMSELELMNKLKLIFNDKLIKSEKIVPSSFYQNFELNSTRYFIKTKTGQLELTIIANFYKNKTFSYQYYHEDLNLEYELRKKNEGLIINYDGLYGHDLFMNESKENAGKVEGVDYIASWNLNDSKYSLNEIAISEIKILVLNEEVKYNAEQEKLRLEKEKKKSIGSKM